MEERLSQSPTAESPPVLVRAVGRTARVLRAFSDEHSEFGVNELARHLGMPPATVYRILATLTAEGFLEQDPATGRYGLGPESLFLGLASLNRKHLGTECLPVMRALSARTGESTNLGVLRGGSIIYVQQVESSQPLRFSRDIGVRIPLHSTALGKLLLAFLSEARQQELLANMELVRYTPFTITDREELARHLCVVRERGYAVTDEEHLPDLRGLAVPVRNYTGEVVAGLSVMGPSSRLTRDLLESYRHDVADAAAHLSRQLGYR